MRREGQHVFEEIRSRYSDHCQVAVIRYELDFRRILVGITIALYSEITAVGNHVSIRHDAIAAYHKAGPDAARTIAAEALEADAAARIEAPADLPVTIQPVMSTQTGFGALLNELGREPREPILFGVGPPAEIDDLLFDITELLEGLSQRRCGPSA